MRGEEEAKKELEKIRRDNPLFDVYYDIDDIDDSASSIRAHRSVSKDSATTLKNNLSKNKRVHNFHINKAEW